MSALLDKKTAELPSARPRRRIPTELGILLVLLGIGLAFEAFGWVLRDQSFLMNSQRLVLMILQVSIIGLLAIAVTQVIITTGIDLSSGSVLALSAMVAASLAQGSDFGRAVFPSLTDLPSGCRSWPASGWGCWPAPSTAASSPSPASRPSSPPSA